MLKVSDKTAFQNGPRIKHRQLEQQNAKNYCSTSSLLKSSQFVAKSIYYASCIDVRDLTGYRTFNSSYPSKTA